MMIVRTSEVSRFAASVGETAALVRRRRHAVRTHFDPPPPRVRERVRPTLDHRGRGPGRGSSANPTTAHRFASARSPHHRRVPVAAPADPPLVGSGESAPPPSAAFCRWLAAGLYANELGGRAPARDTLGRSRRGSLPNDAGTASDRGHQPAPASGRAAPTGL